MPITRLRQSTVQIGADHWLEGVVRCASPNCDDRTDPDDIALMVIHNISLPPGQFGGDLVEAILHELSRLHAQTQRCGSRRRARVVAPVRRSARRSHAVRPIRSSARGTRASRVIVAVKAATTIRSASSWKAPTTFAYEDAQYACARRTWSALMIRHYPAIVARRRSSVIRKSRRSARAIPGSAFDWRAFIANVVRVMGAVACRASALISVARKSRRY